MQEFLLDNVSDGCKMSCMTETMHMTAQHTPTEDLCQICKAPLERIGGLGKCHLHAAAPEIAAERDWLREINAELLKACIWAEKALAPFSKEPAEKSGISILRAAIARAKEKGG